MVTAQGNTFNQLDTETGKYRKTGRPESVHPSESIAVRPLPKRWSNSFSPGLLPVVHAALVHVQDEIGPGEPRPHIVGK